ncbi:hypothetical protein ACSBR2_031874 [Camellia fascicularis]
MAASWAKGTSSSSIAPQCKYDVFLSFSGIDTRKNFTGHLLAALEWHGFYTFRDDKKLKRGEDIGAALLEAIESSRISVIMFSENYAASSWCLDELVKTMECRKTFQQTVLPIFYDIVPSDVRAQNGSFAETFAKHEERFTEGSDGKVKKWRTALTEAANLSGWDLKNVDNGDEAQLIEKIVEEVGNILDLEHLSVADHPLGLEDRMQELSTLLGMDSNNNDVCIVAVLGIGGIGMTTIAKKLYNLIHHETHRIRNPHQGKEVIKRRALCQKVLLVLDDVDDVQQLTGLAIDRDYFGSGSKIVIATRDLSSLNIEVDKIYTPKELDMGKSLQLFSWNAFREDHPKENYICTAFKSSSGLH